jgi:hypothetical protein
MLLYLFIECQDSTNGKGTYSLEAINTAVQKILQNSEKFRKVANETGINKSTLCRYVKKATTVRAATSVGYYSNRKMFEIVWDATILRQKIHTVWMKLAVQLYKSQLKSSLRLK